jgi:hypothetical protein
VGLNDGQGKEESYAQQRVLVAAESGNSAVNNLSSRQQFARAWYLDEVAIPLLELKGH